MTKIEIEVKLELSAEEFKACQAKMASLDFNWQKTSALKDYLYDVVKYDDSGFDFARIRVYNDSTYEKTIKKWVATPTGKIREETETVSDQAELAEVLASKTVLTIIKNRTDYTGASLDYPAIISFDEIIFPNETCYCVECEIEATEEINPTIIRPQIKQWLINNLGLSDRPEGSSLVKLAMSKVAQA